MNGSKIQSFKELIKGFLQFKVWNSVALLKIKGHYGNMGVGLLIVYL